MGHGGVKSVDSSQVDTSHVQSVIRMLFTQCTIFCALGGKEVRV